MKLNELFKAKKETPEQASARYEKFAKMLAAEAPGVTQQQVDGIKKIADSLWDEKFTAKEKNLIGKHGVEWYELVKKQYPVAKNDDGDWVVSSKIRDWAEGKDWPFQYKAQALEKVEQLVRWLADGRKRGFGDKEADVEKWIAKLDAADKSKAE